MREHLGKGDADKNPAYRAALDKLHTSLTANGLTTPDVVEPFKAARSQNERAVAVRAAAKKWGVDVQSADYVLQKAAKSGAETKEQPKPADLKEAPKADQSTAAFFTPPPVQGNLLNDNGGEWVKPLTSGEKAKPLYAPNSDTPTRTKEEIDGKSAIQRSMEEKEQAKTADEVQTLPTEYEDTSSPPEAEQPPAAAEGDEEVGAVAVDPSTPQAVASHFQFSPQGDDLSDRLDRVYEGVKAGVPSLTPEKWRNFLQKAWDAKALELQGINEVRGVLDTPGASDKVLQKKDANGDVGRMLAYAVVKDPQKLQAMIQQELMGQGGADNQQADTRQAEKQYGWMNQADLMKVAQQKGVKIDPRDDRTKILQKISAT